MLKPQKIFLLLAIVSYLSIILMGQMIGVPLLVWLLFNIFNFGQIDQLSAILAIVGLCLLVKYATKPRTLTILLIDLLCFFLLTLPIIGRLLVIPFEKFAYATFILPLSLFVAFYFISLWYAYRQYTEAKMSVN